MRKDETHIAGPTLALRKPKDPAYSNPLVGTLVLGRDAEGSQVATALFTPFISTFHFYLSTGYIVRFREEMSSDHHHCQSQWVHCCLTAGRILPDPVEKINAATVPHTRDFDDHARSFFELRPVCARPRLQPLTCTRISDRIPRDFFRYFPRRFRYFPVHISPLIVVRYYHLNYR